MTRVLSIVLLAGLWAAIPASAQFHQPNTAQGLEVKEYPRAESQSTSEKAFVETDALGDPIGETYLISNLNGWTYTTERNAVARGFLQIAKAGTYHFMSNSYYDRNMLSVAGEVVCGFRDGDTTVGTIELKAGRVPIESIGYVDGRGGTVGVSVKWKPPGQREFSEIPEALLRHRPRKGLTLRVEETLGGRIDISAISNPNPNLTNLRAQSMTVVAKDFVIEVYHNGVRIPQDRRELLLDRFGATAERITADVKPGDWLVFHVANNRLRHEGSKFFAVTGTLGEGVVTFVSELESEHWSVCDSPRNSGWFIRERNFGTEARAVAIANPWEEGEKFMKEYSGHAFSGDAIWGAASSTWIKYQVPQVAGRIPLAPAEPEEAPEETEETLEVDPKGPELAILEPERPVVQILSAVYGTGGKNADVTARVKEYVEEKRARFAANPKHLGADPNPRWNKGLRIVFMKDGVRRIQSRNENEHILPESFYGPQDAAELTRWLTGTRWQGLKGEVQFHPNGLLTGPDLSGDAQWKTTDKRRLEILWADETTENFVFNHTWSGFEAPENGQNPYRLVQ